MNQRLFLVLTRLNLPLCSSAEAFAGRFRNSYYHRRAAAFAQSQRNQMIRSLKAQVSAANQVLKTAQCQLPVQAIARVRWRRSPPFYIRTASAVGHLSFAFLIVPRHCYDEPARVGGMATFSYLIRSPGHGDDQCGSRPGKAGP